GGGEGRGGGQGSQQFLHVQLLVGWGAGSGGWPVARSSSGLFAREMDHQAVADHLQHLHQDQQEDDGDRHHVRLVTLVAVAHGQVAETAAADQAAHGGVGNQGDGGHRGGGDQPRQGLRQQRAEDDLQGG